MTIGENVKGGGVVYVTIVVSFKLKVICRNWANLCCISLQRR